MPAWLIPAIIGGLTSALASMVGRVLLTLGMTYVTFAGFNIVIEEVFSLIRDSFAGLPAQVLGLVGYLWVDKAISLIFSAYSAAFVIRSMGAASFTRMVLKAPTPGGQ